MREHLGSFPVSSVAEKTFDEPEGLNFFECDVHVYGIESGIGLKTLNVIFDHPALHGNSMMMLLDNLKPAHNALEDAPGILADWQLPFSSPENPEDSRLLMIHRKGMPNDWPLLEAECMGLLGSLGEYRNSHWMFGMGSLLQPAERIEGWSGPIGFTYNPPIPTSRLISLMAGTYGYADVRNGIVDDMRRVAGFSEDLALLRGRSDKWLFEYFKKLDFDQRRQFIPRFYELPQAEHDDKQRHFADALVKEGQEFITDEGVVVYALGLSPGENAEKAYEAREKSLRIQYPSCQYEIMPLDSVFGSVHEVIPGTVEYKLLRLKPAIQWILNAPDKRTFKPYGKANGYTQPGEVVLSGVAGLMALSYLNPEVRSSWPTSSGLPGSETTQRFGMAQVPLLAIRSRDELLQTELFRRAESLAA